MSNWMFRSMKMGLSSILTALVFLQLLNTTYAMSCSYQFGNVAEVSLSCPMILQSESKQYCCYTDTSAYCCDLNEYIQTNIPILVGIIVGVIVLLLIILICSCCCCSCCLLAKRRQQRGTVLYAPRI